jgi:amidophosphoribosyltransferase
VANGLSVDEICTSIGADSLGYVDLDELIASTNVPADKLCRACFDGVYPVPLPPVEHLGKDLLELDVVHRTTDVDGLPTVTSSPGAAEALTRP